MWRRAKRRFSIYAPKVSIRPHIPWYLRWSLVLPFVIAAGLLIWFAYNSGLQFAGFNRGETIEELTQLRNKAAKLEAENVQLNSQVVKYERQMQMAQGSSQETVHQLKVLNDENAKLQEDLAFFQSLTATHAKEGELAVHRLRVEHDKMPGEFRVRMLLVQSGQRAKEFAGNYQIVATFSKSGQKITQLFPQVNAPAIPFQLKFKYYQRVEQSIQLPQDAHLESVQVRVFEQGEREPKVRQNVSVS
jgi:hypothetical protein